MNNTIKQIKEVIANNEKLLEEEYRKVFNADKELIKRLDEGVKEVESSNDYTYDEYGEIHLWSRFDCKDILEELRESVDEYLSDYCVYIDYDNDALMISEGECIVINYEGDIFEGNKLIIGSSDYETGEQRNELIEKHMEETGCFPPTLESDYYGGLTYVNTRKGV